jgi:hypothetical protein
MKSKFISIKNISIASKKHISIRIKFSFQKILILFVLSWGLSWVELSWVELSWVEFFSTTFIQMKIFLNRQNISFSNELTSRSFLFYFLVQRRFRFWVFILVVRQWFVQIWPLTFGVTSGSGMTSLPVSHCCASVFNQPNLTQLPVSNFVQL